MYGTKDKTRTVYAGDASGIPLTVFQKKQWQNQQAHLQLIKWTGRSS